VHRKVAIESALADLQVLRKSKVELLHKWKVPCQIKEEGQQDKWVKPEREWRFVRKLRKSSRRSKKGKKPFYTTYRPTWTPKQKSRNLKKKHSYRNGLNKKSFVRSRSVKRS